MKLESLALHHGYTAEETTKSAAVPIYQTTSYVFGDTDDASGLFGLKPEVWAPRLNLDTEGLRPEDFPPEATGNIYTRIMNPTTDVLERRMALLEGGVGALAKLGASAFTNMLHATCLPSGDHTASDGPSRNCASGKLGPVSR